MTTPVEEPCGVILLGAGLGMVALGDMLGQVLGEIADAPAGITAKIADFPGQLLIVGFALDAAGSPINPWSIPAETRGWQLGLQSTYAPAASTTAYTATVTIFNCVGTTGDGSSTL
jgi:hypothetical protein